MAGGTRVGSEAQGQESPVMCFPRLLLPNSVKRVTEVPNAGTRHGEQRSHTSSGACFGSDDTSNSFQKCF